MFHPDRTILSDKDENLKIDIIIHLFFEKKIFWEKINYHRNKQFYLGDKL